MLKVLLFKNQENLRHKVNFSRVSIFTLLLMLILTQISAPSAAYARTAAQIQPLPLMQTFQVGLNKDFSPISIPAGGIATLSVSLFNPNPFELILSSDPPAWTDTLPAGVYFASPPNATTTCGGTVTTIGSTLALIGGTVPAQVGLTPGSCTVTVKVSSITAGNHINSIPANTVRATNPAGTIQLTNPTPADATLRVNTVQPPSLSKTFSPNTIWVGQTSTLTITLRNTDTGTDLTNVSLTDNLPANVTVAAPPASPQCGGSITSTATSVTLTGGTIPKQVGSTPGSCTIVVTVTSTVAGSYTNVIPANAIQCTQGVTNTSAASAPLNVQSLGVSKSFSPQNFQAGGSSTLTITLQNPTPSAYTGVSFTDNLPAGLLVAAPPVTPQCGGSVSSTASSVTLSGGTIPGGTFANPGTCTITFTVTSDIPANYTNSLPAGSVTTNEGATNTRSASTNVRVYGDQAGITGSKSFSPSSITVGGTSTLTINIQAPADSQLTNFSLTDALPSGVRVANPPNATKNTNCVGGVFAPSAGDTTLTYTGGTIPINTNCRLTVSVIGEQPGSFTNVISPANISNNENRNITSNITATLTVSGLSVSKVFQPGTVNPNGVSTLTITLTNNNTEQIDNVSLTNTLPGTLTQGVVIANPPRASTTCGGGSVTATAGTQTITLSNGIIPAKVGSVAGICTIVVDVVGKGTSATHTNTIPAGGVTGVIHGTSISISNPSAATATLRILAITIGVVKGFNPLTVSGNSASTLSIELSNPNNVPLTGIAFSDNLPQRPPDGGMYIANPPNFSVGTCGGTISGSPGDTSFSYSGGSLPPNGSCTLSLSVGMNVENNLINEIPAGGVTSTNGASNPQAANATLTNMGGAGVSKYFITNPILPGGTSTLRITIQNISNFPVTGMGLIDTLPSGLTIASPPATPQCGGTVSGTPGTNVIELSNGTVAASSSCTIDVDVTTLTIGNYRNCIPAGALRNDQSATNQTEACDTLVVNTPPSPPSISKSFSPNPIAAGENSILTFTITNPNPNTALTGVGFSDTFPGGMTLSSIPNASQCNGTVSSTANSITLSGGSIAANSSCTIVVRVTATPGGSYSNTSGTVTSTNGGDGNTASDILTVIDPPSMSKAFSPASIPAGGTSTLTFTINNPNVGSGIALTGVGFTDTLPTGIRVADPPSASHSGCGTPVFTPVAGATGLSFSSASVIAGVPCTVSVNVSAENGGSYVNTSGAVTSTNGGTGNTATDTLTVTGSGLSLDKSTTTISYRQAGDTIAYSYLLTNTGDSTLYGTGSSGEFVVSDDRATVTCPPATTSLAPSETVTCTATYVVQAADITARSITNTASAQASDGAKTITSNTDSITVRLAALRLTKSTPTQGYREAGNTITYNYILTNTGEVTLHAPFEISDDRIGTPPGTPFSCGSVSTLAPGANITCTRNYTITAGDVTARSVTNTATGTAQDAAAGGNTVTSNQRSVTVYLVLPPLISKAFAPNPIPVGSTSEITFTITNPPSNVVPLTGIGFSDNLPSGLTVAAPPDADQCGGTVSSTATSITFSGGTVLANRSCTIKVTVTSVNPGSYPNTTSTITSSNGGTGATSNTAVLNVVSPPSIAKSFSPTAITVGGVSRMSFIITNPNTSNALTGVGFTDTFPSGLEVANPPNISLSGCGTPLFAPASGDTSLTLSAASIAAGSTCTIALDVTGLNRGSKNNTTSTITSTEGGTGATSNTATLLVDEYSLALSKSIASGNPYSTLGGSIQYQYLLTNTGTVTLIGNGTGGLFTVSDDRATVTCPPTPTGLAPNASITCTATHTVTQADLDSGFIINTATAHGLYGSTPVTSNQDTQTATATQSPALTLAKSIIIGNPYTAAGETITYRYQITNSGNVTLSGNGTGGRFTVSDDHIGTPPGTAFTCGTATTLAPGASITCTASYTVLQTDVDNGSVTNIATAYGLFNGNLITSNQDTKTASAGQSSDLTLSKTINSGNPFRAPGDVVEYSYLLTNNGNVTLTGNGTGGVFTITDDHIGIPAGTPFDCGTVTSLAPGESVSCVASYTITQSDRDNESVTNRATGHGLFGATPITSNQSTATANVARGSIEGVKFFDINGNQTQDSNEPGVNNVTIQLYDSTGVNLLDTTTTTSDGRFSFSNLLPRTYIVVEIIPSGSVSTTPTRFSTTVLPGEVSRISFGNYQINSGGTNRITGTVYDDANVSSNLSPGELPLANITVTLYDQNGNIVATTTTAADGTYSFQNLPAGIYTVVQTNLGGYVSTTLDHVSVVLSSGTHAVVNFGDQQNPSPTIVDPAVTKHGDPANARIGDIVIFTITVGNNGNTDAQNVVLTDTMPAFLNILTIEVAPDRGFPINITGNTFTINFGTIRPIDFYTVTVTTVVNAQGRAPGGSNQVSILSSSTPDPILNNSASFLITIPAAPQGVKKEEEEEEGDPLALPRTGFAPGRITPLAVAPESIQLLPGEMTIEIPALGIKEELVGIPRSGNSWNVDWLGKRLGYLYGTAFPTWAGNSVITGHVYGANGLPGPLFELEKLQWGDSIIIHAFGQKYFYEVRSVSVTGPSDTRALKHEILPWVTLITCKDYDEKTDTYQKRVVVRAVQVRIETK